MSISIEQISGIINRLSAEGAVVWLDARESTHPQAQYSWIAALPQRIISGYAGQKAWKELSESYQASKDWWFGYLGYDLKNDVENLHSKNTSLIEAPDYWFMIPRIILRIDHYREDISIEKGEEEFKQFSRVETFSGIGDNVSHIQLEPGISQSEYHKAIKAIKKDIYEGRYYELNYTYPLSGSFRGNPLQWYQEIQQNGPVPFGAFINNADVSICCFSPERFLKRTQEKLISQPIKGTRGRKDDDQKDLQLRDELLKSVKDKAENLMIVDLVRNDFHRIANPGTVRVDPLFEVQSFPTVHQLVSTIHGEVDPALNPFDILKACFPMGSMTGAPKIEVMKRIEELETYKRGIYSGSIGYINPNGDFDFNVVIRTAIIQDGKIVYPVGGAITSDSDPNMEWQETIIKARALAQQ